MVNPILLLVSMSGSGMAMDKQQRKGVFKVYDYGAVGDGITLDTKAIQAAIDVCANAGGGKVYLHNGKFLSGTIYLKSNVTLYIEAGAVLLGSTNIEDYPVTIPEHDSWWHDVLVDKSLIYAEKQENIAIAGRGVIDGQGGTGAFKISEETFETYKQRPFIMRIIQCKNVITKNITLRNSALAMQHYLACDNVIIDSIFVHNRANWNNNCLTIDGCHNVRVANCDFSSNDDCFELKSTSNRSCKNITITNCMFSGGCNGFKIGTESNGGFENITISNCTMYNVRLSAIALELVDGGTFDCVNVSDITMKDVGAAIFIRLGNRAKPFKKDMKKPGMGSMRNIMISNIQATGVGKPFADPFYTGYSKTFGERSVKPGIGLSITGLPGHPVENVTLDNIRLQFEGGGTREEASREVPEFPEKYPEYDMFGILPAYGFYVRHVKNLRFHNMDFGFEKDDHRPALIFEDVQDLDVFNLNAQSMASTPALIWLKQVDGAFIHGCRSGNNVTTFIRVNGDRSNNIAIMNNYMSKAGQVLEKGKDVVENAVYLGNKTKHE